MAQPEERLGLLQLLLLFPLLQDWLGPANRQVLIYSNPRVPQTQNHVSKLLRYRRAGGAYDEQFSGLIHHRSFPQEGWSASSCL